MTERPDSRAAEPPEIAEVRRLLAEARPTEPMPADVATRLDAVLAGLAGLAEPGADTDQPGRPEASPAPVLPIAAHRRRRAAALLVAAAAIVLGGVALVPHVHLGGSGPNPAAASGADSSGGRTTELAPNNGPSADSGAPPAPHSLTQARIRNGRVLVRPEQFSADALAARSLLSSTPSAGTTPFLDRTGPCRGLPRHVRSVPAEYLHAPAALVFRRAQGASQVVDLYVCGDRRPVRSATLPAH